MMIRESNNRGELIEQLIKLIPAAQAETQAVDQSAAAHLGVNLTDLRCLGILLADGPLSAGGLAAKVRLTRGAMTTALDRLERARLVRRQPSGVDRRGVMVEPTAAAKASVAAIWQPIGVEGLRSLDDFNDKQLAILVRFFDQYCELQRRHSQRIRASAKPRRKTMSGRPAG